MLVGLDSCRLRGQHLPLANTAGVAFGAHRNSHRHAGGHHRPAPSKVSRAAVARILHTRLTVCPAYLILVMYGRKGLRGVLPAVAVCGIALHRPRSWWFRIPSWRRSPAFWRVSPL